MVLVFYNLNIDYQIYLQEFQSFLNEETFLKKIRDLESKLLSYKKTVNQEEKSLGNFERTRNQVLKLHGYNPSEWEGLGKSWKIAFMIEAPFISIEQEIKNLEIGIVKTFDRRDQLRAEEIRLEKLKRRYKKVMYKIRKLESFLDKEYKKLRQERNENLISLFDSNK